MIHERFAQLREACPNDIARIEGEEARVTKLLKQQEYFNLEGTQEFLGTCRREIVRTRIKLATERNLSPQQQTELWQIIDAREWFVKMVSQDYAGQLEEIDRELEAELGR
jgi:hypothetical protein